MPGNRPNPRPAAGGLQASGPRRTTAQLLAALLLAALVLIPAVSALELQNEVYEYTSFGEIASKSSGAGAGNHERLGNMFVSTSYPLENVEYILIQSLTGASDASPQSNHTTVEIWSVYGSEHYASGTLGYFKYQVGTTWWVQYYLEDLVWYGSYPGDSEKDGVKCLRLDYTMDSPMVDCGSAAPSTLNTYMGGSIPWVTFGKFTSPWTTGPLVSTANIYSYAPVSWKNQVVVTEETPVSGVSTTYINVIKEFEGDYVTDSTVCIEYGDTISTQTTDTTAHYVVGSTQYPIKLGVLNVFSGVWYNSTYHDTESPEDPTAPDDATATVYVQSSQTGALLANANLAILAAAGGTETEIINATLPGGTGTYTLQPTGGGLPNPDYYRAVATVPGFTQIVENHSFTLNGPHDVIIEMRPDSGGPADPERAYLEFYVRDYHANGIPAASIQCGGRILQTNSAGYAVFEVAKNSTHPWIAKKSGYTTIEGTATTGPNPRYVVNVVLGPGTVPTYTPGPGETPGGPGATPTPDRRTNEEKGQSIIDMIADNAEGIAALAIIGTLLGLLKLIAKW